MSQRNETHEKTRKLVGMALLIAIIAVLQLFAGSIKIGVTSFSLVLVPIVVGAILYGPTAGGILGGVFGLIVLIVGISGTDQFTFFLWTSSPFWTIVTCMGKGIGCGVAAGWVYRALRGKNQTLACTLSAMSAPVVNTGIFALIMSTVLRAELQQVLGVSSGEVISVLFLTVIGINFLVEFALNAILSAAIARIVQVASKK